MDYKVTEGISDSQIDQLINYSNTDSLVTEETSDATRFKNKKSFDFWRKKGRKIYVMADQSGNLLGIIWLGEKNIPSNKNYFKKFELGKYKITMAIRLYEDARGRGLSKMFMNKAWDMYKKTDEFKNAPEKRMWLETYENNIPAISAYKKFGFEAVSRPDENGRIIMALFNSQS